MERQRDTARGSVIFSTKWRSGVWKEIENLRGGAQVFEPYLKRLTSGPMDKAVGSVVELLAEVQVQRRQTKGDSLAFHTLTGAMVAYGKVLGLFLSLKQLQSEPRGAIGGSYPLENGEASFGKPSIVWSKKDHSEEPEQVCCSV
jgi:hypothetical protein